MIKDFKENAVKQWDEEYFVLKKEAIKKSKIKKYQMIKSKMLDQSDFERNYVRDKKLDLYIDYKKHIFAVEYFSWRL